MFDFVGVGILVLLLVLFGWLTTRAWKIRHGGLRWLATIPAGLLTLLALLLTGAALNGFYKLNRTYDNPVREFSVTASPERLAQGQKLIRACAGCHSATGDLPLLGQNFVEGGGPPVGTLWAPALTAAHFSEWSDGEIIRALREGVHRSGRSLLIMPAGAFHTMSDEDAQSIVAFIRQHEPNAPDTPQNNVNVVGALLVNVAPFQTRQEPITASVTAPPAGPSPEYGAYLLGVSGCRDCHGANLAGGIADPNGPPGGPNISGADERMTLEQFITMFRTGTRPNGSQLSEAMPWKDYELFSDEDLTAMYRQLESLQTLPDNQ
jgi:cytochrome c553